MSLYDTQYSIEYVVTAGTGGLFDFTFGAMEPNDIFVYDVNPEVSPADPEYKKLIADAVVAPAPTPGGIRDGGTVAIPADSIPPVGHIVEIIRRTDRTQENAIEPNAKILNGVLESMFDKLTMIVQEGEGGIDQNQAIIEGVLEEIDALKESKADLVGGKVPSSQLPLASNAAPGAVMADGVTTVIDSVTGAITAIGGGGGNAVTGNHAALYGKDLPKQHSAGAVFDYGKGQDQATINTGFAASLGALARPATTEYDGLMSKAMFTKLDGISLVTSERDGLMPAAMYGFFVNKGAVAPIATLYIRIGGNDNDDGLSEGAALASLTKAGQLINTEYKGMIAALTLDLGAGTFESDWTPADIEVGPKRLAIQGTGMDSTTIYSEDRWNMDSNAAFCPYKHFENFTFKRKATASTDVSPSIGDSSGNLLSISNIRIDHTELTNIAANGLGLGLNSGQLFIANALNFKGRFGVPLYFSGGYGRQAFFTSTFKLTMERNATCNYIMSSSYGARITIDAQSADNYPAYNNVVPATSFGRFAFGSDVIFYNSAALTAWLNGWNYTADAASKFRTRAEA